MKIETKIEKIRFAENLGGHVVSVKDGKVIVHCIGWNDLAIEVKDGEDAEGLRRRVFELIKGTPCGIDDVQALLELTLS